MFFRMARLEQDILQALLLTLTQVMWVASDSRLWKTLYMDHMDDCESVVRNDDMGEGDKYRVKSRTDPGIQQPAECSMGFNFGDRFVSLNVRDWWCDPRNATREPFLAVYDDCHASRGTLLALMNCTSPLPPMPVTSPSSCLSLYHYRDHTTRTYYFDIEVVAEQEVLAFPAGGVAAVIISSVIVLMIVVKITCVISGYERRLPNIHFMDPEEQKHIMEGSMTDQLIQIHNNTDEEPLQDNSGATTVPDRDKSQGRSLVVGGAEAGHHRVLTVSRSVGSGSHQSGTADVTSDVEYDFLDVVDLPSTPRLKRYPSAKASSIWRHK